MLNFIEFEKIYIFYVMINKSNENNILDESNLTVSNFSASEFCVFLCLQTKNRTQIQTNGIERFSRNVSVVVLCVPKHCEFGIVI